MLNYVISIIITNPSSCNAQSVLLCLTSDHFTESIKMKVLVLNELTKKSVNMSSLLIMLQCTLLIIVLYFVENQTKGGGCAQWVRRVNFYSW